MDINHPVPTLYGEWANQWGEAWKQQVSLLKEKFGAAIEEVLWPREYPTDVPIVFVALDQWVSVLEFAKNDPGMGYKTLTDFTATDEQEDPRFNLVIQLFSPTAFHRIRFKTRVAENQVPKTLVKVWVSANWCEREIWDMFGIKFEGHPDLRRILMDQRWEGHPMRKDYPLRGYQVFPTAEAINPKLLEE